MARRSAAQLAANFEKSWLKPVWMTPSALRSAAAQAVQILDIAAMRLGASGPDRLRTRLRACKAEHLMTRPKQFPHDGRTDKTGGAGNEHTHDDVSLVFVEGWAGSPLPKEIVR